MSDDHLYRRSAKIVLAEAEAVIAAFDHLTSGTDEVQKALDRKATATRMLELLPPADDATLVTVEWLKDVGFVCEDGVFIREQDIGYDCHVVGLMTENATEWELYDSFGSGENKVSAFALPTRGHVRRLCQAIGINLTESK